MHPAAQRYFNMDLDDQKKVQILLCKRALEVWEHLVPDNLSYRESVAGSKQVFKRRQLPRWRMLYAASASRWRLLKMHREKSRWVKTGWKPSATA